jgi:hypothetical protein
LMLQQKPGAEASPSPQSGLLAPYLFANPRKSNAGSAASSGVSVFVVPMMRLAGGVVAGAIDRFDHPELAGAETEGRERPRRRIAAHHPLVDAMRKARDHQLQVALVAPEPGQFIVGLRLADDGGPKMRR